MAVYSITKIDDLEKVMKNLIRKYTGKNNINFTLEEVQDDSQHTKYQLKSVNALMSAFYKSGLSSYKSLEDMKTDIKRRIGLVEVLREPPIDESDKKMILEVLDLLPLSKKSRRKMDQALDGIYERVGSFSDADKEQMSSAIRLLIEMIQESGALSDFKCQMVVEGLTQGRNIWM